MKICHITTVHKRYDTRIFYKECKSLYNNGYDVSLIVSDNLGDEVANGINIFDLGKKKGFIHRLLLCSKVVFNAALKTDASIFHFHDPELFLTGLKLKKAGKIVIWDMHENIYADIKQKKYIPYLLKIIILFIYKLVEKYTVKKIDFVICTRESVLYRLIQYNKNVFLINNFPLLNDLYDSIKINNLKKIKTICFAGAIVPNYQHKEIIEAISEIDNVKYVLAGPVKESYLNELKSIKGWEKVEYKGILNIDEVNKLYAMSSIGVVIHKYTQNMDWTVGNFALTKIFEVMHWGIPVIATNYSMWENIVFDEYKCAITVNPYNVEEIKNAIMQLLKDPERANNMGKIGRFAVIEKFNWKSQEKILLKIYNSIQLV